MNLHSIVILHIWQYLTNYPYISIITEFWGFHRCGGKILTWKNSSNNITASLAKDTIINYCGDAWQVMSDQTAPFRPVPLARVNILAWRDKHTTNFWWCDIQLLKWENLQKPLQKTSFYYRAFWLTSIQVTSDIYI